jgi:hypothetical protein
VRLSQQVRRARQRPQAPARPPPEDLLLAQRQPLDLVLGAVAEDVFQNIEVAAAEQAQEVVFPRQLVAHPE